MEKISFSGFLQEIIMKPQGLPCFSLQAELNRARTKQERAYQKFWCKQQEMEIQVARRRTTMVMAGRREA
jgi:hypothetical protein